MYTFKEIGFLFTGKYPSNEGKNSRVLNMLTYLCDVLKAHQSVFLEKYREKMLTSS